MRVLHLGKFYPPVSGGIETFLRDLLVAQRERGDEASAIVHAGKHPPPQGEAGWLIQVPVWAHWIFAPISPGFPLALWRAIRSRKPDVLHLHLPNLSAFWALFFPSARRIPWVVHWHSDVLASKHNRGLRLAYPFYRPFEQAVLRQAAVIVVTSPPYLSSSEALIEWREKCTVLPLGVDSRRLPEISASDTTGLWKPGCLRILAIGRLTYYKGLDTLVRALAAVSPSTSVQLLIVGEGEERRRLEDLIVSTGQKERVRLLGGLDDDARNRLLASCDIFCLPSRERTEAFGIVLMEAMRYGKPVLASRVMGSGMTWVVESERNGRLVPCDDVSAWAAQLDELGNDPGLRQRLGDEGKRQFSSRFSIRSVTEPLADLYCVVSETCEEGRLSQMREEPLIVIPARNEAESVLNVLDALRRQGYVDNVVLIDDGSTDATAEIARSTGVMVISPALSQGAWGAIQTGMRYAVRQGYCGVITLDADGQHEPECIPALLEAAKSADVVIGACPERGSLLRKFAWGFFRGLSGFGIEDLTSGFRYYSADACMLLAEEEATLLDYQDVGVLLLLRKGGFAMAEVPVAMYPRRSGPSRIFSSWRLVGRYMLETTLLCFANWHPRHMKRR
jgi:glycosyltransferase involved in cell wall biosynthesis